MCLLSVPVCVSVPLWLVVCVCVRWENAVVLWDFKDAGMLCYVRLHADRLSLMNNYLQQCKTNPLIMMRRWALFQHDSRRCLLCSALVRVSQGRFWINSNWKGGSAPSGMLSCIMMSQFHLSLWYKWDLTNKTKPYFISLVLVRCTKFEILLHDWWTGLKKIMPKLMCNRTVDVHL